MYRRKDVITIEEFESLFKDTVLANLEVSSRKIRVKVGNESIKAISDRYKCFLLSGYDCVSCGTKGSYFAIENTLGDITYHLNLYSEDHVLMTKDHIVPRGSGGMDHYSNYQTMCVVCNGLKGNSLVGDEPIKIRRRYLD